MYTIGVQLQPSDLFNCTAPDIDMEAGLAPAPPGRNPENRESNITLYTSESISGPWERYGVVLGPDFQGAVLFFIFPRCFPRCFRCSHANLTLLAARARHVGRGHVQPFPLGAYIYK